MKMQERWIILWTVIKAQYENLVVHSNSHEILTLLKENGMNHFILRTKVHKLLYFIYFRGLFVVCGGKCVWGPRWFRLRLNTQTQGIPSQKET